MICLCTKWIIVSARRPSKHVRACLGGELGVNQKGVLSVASCWAAPNRLLRIELLQIIESLINNTGPGGKTISSTAERERRHENGVSPVEILLLCLTGSDSWMTRWTYGMTRVDVWEDCVLRDTCFGWRPRICCSRHHAQRIFGLITFAFVGVDADIAAGDEPLGRIKARLSALSACAESQGLTGYESELQYAPCAPRLIFKYLSASLLFLRHSLSLSTHKFSLEVGSLNGAWKVIDERIASLFWVSELVCSVSNLNMILMPSWVLSIEFQALALQTDWGRSTSGTGNIDLSEGSNGFGFLGMRSSLKLFCYVEMFLYQLCDLDVLGRAILSAAGRRPLMDFVASILISMERYFPPPTPDLRILCRF